MKLAQRIALGYYKTKFRTLALLSPRKAAEAAFILFCTPYSGKPKREIPAIFHKATPAHFTLDELTIRGWKWQSQHTNGKKVLIVHGFDSCSYKFDKYVTALLHEGFEVLAFDAPGHGTSDGKRLNVLIYRNMLWEINNRFGPLYGIMAHSIGGLAAAVAAEQLPGLSKLVLIAPATETSSAVTGFAKLVGLTPELKKELEQVIIRLGKLPVSYYSISRALPNITTPILWLHDEDDKICSFSDVKPVRDTNPSNTRFLITKGLGHNKIYRDDKVRKEIISFFTIS